MLNQEFKEAERCRVINPNGIGIAVEQQTIAVLGLAKRLVGRREPSMAGQFVGLVV